MENVRVCFVYIAQYPVRAKMPNLRNGSKEGSNTGTLVWEAGVIPLSNHAPHGKTKDGTSVRLTPCVKMAGFPDSNISSNSSLVVVRPATETRTRWRSCHMITWPHISTSIQQLFVTITIIVEHMNTDSNNFELILILLLVLTMRIHRRTFFLERWHYDHILKCALICIFIMLNMCLTTPIYI